MLPSIRLGGPAVFLTADSAWRLLAVSADGVVRLWNLRLMSLELETSVEPLLLGAASADRGVALNLSPFLGASNSCIVVSGPVESGITVRGSVVLKEIALPAATPLSGYFLKFMILPLRCIMHKSVVSILHIASNSAPPVRYKNVWHKFISLQSCNATHYPNIILL